MLLKIQRTALVAHVVWTKQQKRSHEFAWLEAGRETILIGETGLIIKPESSHQKSYEETLEL